MLRQPSSDRSEQIPVRQLYATYARMLRVVGEHREVRVEYKFADGLRAIAALAVACFHTYVFTGHSGDVEQLPAVFKVFQLGNFGVPFFIVLSGFVLMLPIARTADLHFKRGVKSYIQRRARRILPPYFVAMALFLVLIWLVPLLQEPAGTAWDSKIPVTWGGVLSHVFLVHNLHPDWLYQINGPAWSVATEWQIYFLMPFVLLPLWRRFGIWLTMTAAVLIGCGLHFVVPALDGAHFWFIGLFAFGMAAAYAVVRNVQIPKLGPALAVVVPLTLIALTVGYAPAQRVVWLSESYLGIVVALSLVWLSQRDIASPSWIHRVLESRPLVWVGLWSYSIYLIHSPLLGLGNLLLLEHFEMSTQAQFAVMVGLVLPISLVVSYGFHHLVERHFMTSHQRKLESEPVATSASDAQPRVLERE